MCQQRRLRPWFHYFPHFALLQGPTVQPCGFSGSCQRIARVLDLVLERSTSTSTGASSETQLEKALHLIRVAVHEEQRLWDKGVPMAGSFAFTCRATQGELAAALEKSVLGTFGAQHNSGDFTVKSCLSRETLSYVLTL
nr:uncharacterized protein LOC129381127 isoform X2 [Dermacentor andersoni]